MALIDTLIDLPYTAKEVVKVIRKEPYTKPNGAQSYLEKVLGEFKVNIQPLGTLNKIEGLTLENDLKGSGIQEVWGMYSHNFGFKVEDIVVRNSDGLKYEIRSAELNGAGTILEFMKCLIIRIDNQDGN